MNTEPGRLGILLNPVLVAEGLNYAIDAARDCQRSDKLAFFPLLQAASDVSVYQTLQALSMPGRQYVKMVGSNIQIMNPAALTASVRTGPEGAMILP